ncbi:DNA (cytosine-5-)-methyltransferase [Paenibacillus sp. NPDC093718]|uniref:DNA (cytosine-5-)-methyltransferase n=1 Tax=Paenibacillus sp. NPDC093718 TaxID=3390601 RepID=UPI003D090A73
MRMMRKLSLFSGIGGIDLAAHWAGMETVAFCEREPFPQKVLKKHWPDVPIYDDVCTLTAERLKEDGIIGPGRTIDIISGGFPCQPFSHAGKRGGTSDDRYLWPEIVRILQEVQPTWFVGENVAGLISMEQSNSELILEDDTTVCEETEMVLETIKNDLENCGYQAFYVVIPSCAVGAAHRRDRIFIVAYTESKRSGETREHQCRRSEERTAWSSKTMADTNREPRLEADQTACTVGSEWDSRNHVSRSSRASTPQRSGRESESQLGRVFDGISSWLDGYRWPAGLGAEQYDWEPPRVATDVKERVGRLKALGNAVNPVQIYPIMAAIKAIDDQL